MDDLYCAQEMRSLRYDDLERKNCAVRVRVRVRVRNKQTNKQTNVTHIHGPVAAVNAHTLKASGSVTQLESQLL